MALPITRVLLPKNNFGFSNNQLIISIVYITILIYNYLSAIYLTFH
jgi:hypothetical protein